MHFLSLKKDIYESTFWGQTRIRFEGPQTFEDVENGIKATFLPGNVKGKGKTKDHFKTVVFLKGKPVSVIEGSYMGYIRIDGEKYWDARYTKAYKMFIEDSILESDFSRRLDLQCIDEGNVTQGQKEKENLE